MNDGFFLFTLVFIFGCKEERSNLVWSTRSKKISHLCLQEGSNHMELSSFLFLVMAPTISRKHTALEYNECLFPPWKNDVTEDFFFSSGRSVSEGSLYPRGSSLRTSEARAVIETQGGKGCPRIHFCLRRQKKIQGDIVFAM